MWLAAREDFRTGSPGFLDQGHDLVEAHLVDHGPDDKVFPQALVDLDPGHAGFDPLHEVFKDSVLHEYPVGRNAHLARIAQLRPDQAFDGFVDIGVLEHDKGRVASQLHGHLLDGRCALRGKEATDPGRTGEGDLADARVAGQDQADLPGVADHHFEHAFTDAGLACVFQQLESGERGILGRLDDHGAARRERGRHLAGDHHEREVPRRDRRDGANGLFGHYHGGMLVVGRDRVAVDTLGLFGVPLDKPEAVVDFATGFGQALAVLPAQQFSEGFLVGLDAVVPASQGVAAFLRQFRRPLRECRASAINRGLHFGRGILDDTTDFFTGCRVIDD